MFFFSSQKKKKKSVSPPLHFTQLHKGAFQYIMQLYQIQIDTSLVLILFYFSSHSKK
jgi:hypothetical protein